MTIDERRVTTALREYARGVDVTDEDLDLLEARLHERLHPAARRDRGRRRWEWAVAACAVAALVLAVTALWRTRVEETMPATPPVVTPADLAGVWLSEYPRGGGWLWHFTLDGRIGFTNTAKAYVTASEHRQPFALEGDVLDFPENGQRCHATVRQSDEGRMTLTPVLGTPQCDLFDDGDVWDFVRVSPASLAGAMLVSGPNEEDRRPATEPEFMTDVAGTWLFEGTGTVLVVVRSSPREGEYFIDSEGNGVHPDERGAVALPPDGGIVLRPAGAGQGCETVYSRVVSTGVALQLELADTSCGRLGAARDTWIRLN